MSGNATNVARRPQRFGGRHLQFALRDLFLVTSSVCVCLALRRSIGPFLTLLLIGVVVSAGLFMLSRFDKFLLAGPLGAILATLHLLLVRIILGLHEEDYFVLACLLYPLVGYFVGSVCSAHALMRRMF